jgi:hypothetical protein
MALHHDIYWVGRQWAVTGFGVQAVDQRLNGSFDIEAARLCDGTLAERTRALDWVNLADFDKALAIARTRFPQPAEDSWPLVERALELMQQADFEPPPQSTPPQLLSLRTEGPFARFLPQWRIRK